MQSNELNALLKQMRALEASLVSLVTSLNDTPLTGVAHDLFTLERQLRDARHSHPILGDIPDSAWDVLLELEHARRQQRPRVVSDLCRGKRIPLTTVLRQLDRLSAAGLIERTPDPVDRRRIYVSLTAIGSRSVVEVHAQVEPKQGNTREEKPGFREYPGGSVFAA